jgi:hypothetical protein
MIMNKSIVATLALAFILTSCDSQSTLDTSSETFAKSQTSASGVASPSAVVTSSGTQLALRAAVDAAGTTVEEGTNVNSFLEALNQELASAGLGIGVDRAEFVTDPDGGEAGQTVFANDRSLRLSSKWVPGDARRNADGNNITYLNFLDFRFANGIIDSDPIIDASFDTFNGTQCSALPIVKRNDDGTFPSAIFAGGDPFVADIVELGFLPGFFFDLVLGPGASQNVLGVTFTFVFGSFDAEGNFTPSDVDNNGRNDTALKEVWYNDSFAWSASGSGGVDIETVALHENGHALEMGHFGKVSITGNGKLHVSPRAVMNAFILGTQRELLGTDNASYCSNFASWPN